MVQHAPPHLVAAQADSAPAMTARSESVLAHGLREVAALGDGWGFPVILVITVFAVLELTGVLALARGPREPFAGDWMQLIYTGRFSEFLSIWQRWDALWYQHIAEQGYGLEAIAFFPLYPLIVSAVSLLVVGNTVLAGLIVSGVATTVSCYLAIRLLRLELHRARESDRTVTEDAAAGETPRDRGVLFAAAPVLAAALMVLFPTGFFLIAPFTESLFLLLCVAAFYFARRDQPWVAGALGFLASLTRIPGVFLGPALIFENMRQRGTFEWLLRRGGRRPGVDVLAGFLPGVGGLGLILFQAYVMGASRVGLDARSAWGYHALPPWQAVYESFRFVVDRGIGSGQGGIEALNLAALVGFSAIALLGLRRLPFSYWLYAWPSLAVLLTRGMFFSPQMSTARLVLVIFPCFFVLAMWLAPRPRLAALVLVGSFVLQLVLFQYFVRWGFVG